MSEPNSFFAKIKIKKDKFDEFLKSKPEQPILDNNWLEWWNSKEMYGKTELTQDKVYNYEEQTNEDIINGWTNAKQSLTFSDYDLENEVWHFGIIMFTENYSVMIPGLAFIKGVSKYKDDNSDDFAIIYNYFWGDNSVCAYINFKNKESPFDNKAHTKQDVNSENLKYSDSYLNIKWEEFEKNGIEYD